MIRISSILLLFVMLMITHLPLHGQKVGVVLSGGGPRGVCHIGVLKALEEHHIPIDYISGTSMGAIVGGLYAIGYSPDEILDFFSSSKMAQWTSGQIDQKNIYTFKQPFPNASWQIFKIAYDTVIRARLPANIVTPYELDFGFLETFAKPSAAAGYNFDSLYVPFRCVAADIVESMPITLKNGQLGKAIRTSMTFPFYFRPVSINGKVLFDGGMYDNFPVDIMMNDFNPDVLIGSKAAANYELSDIDDVVSLMQSMLMANTIYEIDPKFGVLIEPDLWQVGITDFSYTNQFVDSGYVSTVRQMEQIKALVHRAETLEERMLKREAFRNRIPPLKINSVVIEGVNEKQKIYTRKLINDKKLIEKVNTPGLTERQRLKMLKKSYYRLLGEKNIEYVFPGLYYDLNEGGYDFVLDLKRSDKIEIELGGLVSSKAINEIFFQAEYSIWGRNSLNFIGNAYLGRFHNSGYLGARFDFPFLIPVSLEPSYTLNGWNYFKTNTYFFEDEKPIFLIQQDNFWSVELSTPISRLGKLSGQFQFGKKKDEYYQSNYFTRLDTSDVTYFDFTSPALIYSMNSLNRKQFASAGMMLRLSGRYAAGWETTIPGSTSVDREQIVTYQRWVQVRLQYEHYLPKVRNSTFGIYLEGNLSSQEMFSNYTATILSAPGFEPLPESQVIFLPQFRAYNYLGSGVRSIFAIIKNMDLRLEAYVFQPYREIRKTELGKAEMGKELSRRYYILSSRLVYHAPFGPISTSFDFYDAADEPFVFNINIGYYIFNKRPFF